MSQVTKRALEASLKHLLLQKPLNKITSGHTPGHSPHWIQVSRWTYACIFLPPFAKQIGDIMPANRGN